MMMIWIQKDFLFYIFGLKGCLYYSIPCWSCPRRHLRKNCSHLNASHCKIYWGKTETNWQFIRITLNFHNFPIKIWHNYGSNYRNICCLYFSDSKTKGSKPYPLPLEPAPELENGLTLIVFVLFYFIFYFI